MSRDNVDGLKKRLRSSKEKPHNRSHHYHHKPSTSKNKKKSLRHRKLEEMTNQFVYESSIVDPEELLSQLEEVYDMNGELRNLRGVVSETMDLLFKDSFFDQGLIDVRPIAGKGLVRGSLSPPLLRPRDGIVDIGAKFGDLIVDSITGNARGFAQGGLLRHLQGTGDLKLHNYLKDFNSVSYTDIENIKKLIEQMEIFQNTYNERIGKLKAHLDELSEVKNLKVSLETLKKSSEDVLSNSAFFSKIHTTIIKSLEMLENQANSLLPKYAEGALSKNSLEKELQGIMSKYKQKIKDIFDSLQTLSKKNNEKFSYKKINKMITNLEDIVKQNKQEIKKFLEKNKIVKFENEEKNKKSEYQKSVTKEKETGKK